MSARVMGYVYVSAIRKNASSEHYTSLGVMFFLKVRERELA